MDLRGYASLVVNGNDCRSNGNSGVHIGEGITVSGSEAVNVVISGNILNSNTDDGLTIGGEIVAAAGQLARRITVSGNVCALNTSDGMQIGDASGISITGNTISGNSSHGINLAGAALTDCIIDSNIIRDHSVAAKLGINAASTTITRLLIGNSNLFQNNTTNMTADAGLPAITGATPDVSGITKCRITDGVAKTNFTGGYDGQLLTIVCTNACTLTNGATLNLSGSADYAMDPDDIVILLRRNGNWYEAGRGNNS
jgi:parallel beta-helix repeat protein